jgi:8-oxo-dGTP diphosphatase
MYNYAYARPAVTVDCVIFGFDPAENNRLYLLLIQRKNAPFQGFWALPGGFVDENECPDDSANRELCEETGVENVSMTQFYTFGKPHRDPRGWTISIAYFAKINKNEQQPKAADDATAAEWFALDLLPENLAFDHAEIIEKAVFFSTKPE